MKPKRIVKEVRNEVNTLIISAFGLVAALSWNDAIKALIEELVPTENSWPYLMLNALIVTTIAVIMTLLIKRKTTKEEKK